jgi:D-glycero-alpha-D-manno-heptose-7-phosphate kinase
MSLGERRIGAAAPVRLDFAGGWTDVPPFSSDEGGVVIAAALGLQVHATVRLERVQPGAQQGVRVASDDLGERLDAPSADQLPRTGPLALLSAALRRYPLPGPGELRTRSDVPPGSGLGSSGALDVAMVAALLAARGESCRPLEVAHRAWQVEAADAGIPGGKQDQYIAALGGFQQLRFDDPHVSAHALELDPGVRDALAAATVLCYTGRSRLSGDTIARVIAAYERREPGVTRALFGIRDVAERMPEALRAGNLPRIGALLDANWRHQQALDPVMCTPEMARLDHAVRSVGGFGGKAAGSGAGGCMFFLAPHAARAAEAARLAGADLLPVSWSSDGVMPC